MVAAARAVASRERTVFDDFVLDVDDLTITAGGDPGRRADSRPTAGMARGHGGLRDRPPAVIEFKTATMAASVHNPPPSGGPVAVDLRDDWPTALRDGGFDDTAPTAWSAEGLLVYLPPDAQDRLFDNITALSAPGSRLATEYHPDAGASIGERTRALREQWAGHGFDVDIADLFYAGERTPAADYLRAHGWQVSARTRPEVFAGYGRRFEITDELAPLRDSLALIAVKPDGEEGSR